MRAATLCLVGVLAAAAAGSDSCSGNGFYYEDIKGCDCFPCFEGDTCDKFVTTCMLDDTGGNPNLFEEYWRNHTGPTSAATEQIFYRSPYQLGSSLMRTAASRAVNRGQLLPVLNDTIISLHEKVGNIANLPNKNLVIGSGATELIGAAIFACKQMHGKNKQMYVYARPPYYSGYTGGLLAVGVANVSFTSSTDLDPSSVIEFVAYPNNPTNEFNAPVYPKAACVIHDQVYFWPSLSDIKKGGAPLNTEISLFSMSKLTGHAGTRLGWALVDSEEMTQLMDMYVTQMQIHVSVDAQFRSNTVLQYLQGEDGLAFFSWVRGQMDGRWKQLNAVLAGQNKVKQHSVPGGFYAWIECMDLAPGQTCQSVFNSNGLNPREGPAFGGTNKFTRLELVVASSVWDIFIQRVAALVA
eukprot:TRINITY_DN1371_c1_g5_i2.p1 TRINITY_DN1371_c1_g5~~TRINITY_DN1371_c1_g5_i2.p1  ORF type:complete len:410 (+),score=142.77 TRINITY_DN1371_c1_g5_i2:52-1281(+)